MRILKIDEKWSVSYDPNENDIPRQIFRHGKFHSYWDHNNMASAMFYQLLEVEQLRREREDLRMFCKRMSFDIIKMLK